MAGSRIWRAWQPIWSNLNLTRLHEKLNGAIGDADMEGTSASLTHEQQLYVYLASRSSVQTICEVRIHPFARDGCAT